MLIHPRGRGRPRALAPELLTGPTFGQLVTAGLVDGYPVVVPTSYYTAVQLRGRAEVVDDPEAKTAILRAQLSHMEPRGSERRPPTSDGPDGRLLRGIRGVRVDVREVLAKVKYGGNKSVEHRRAVAARLRERSQDLDRSAADRVVVSPAQPGMGQAWPDDDPQ